MQSYLSIIMSLFVFASVIGAPPATIPPHLYNEFTMNNRIPVIYAYHDGTMASDKPTIYTFDAVEECIAKAKRREQNYYGVTDEYLYQALDAYLPFIQEKDVAVMGSQAPWYEGILLAYGACPTTIEYNRIISYHPNLKVMTVKEYEACPRLFDAVVSISSYEHDGLGRYGDPINPIGDLLAMQKTKSMLKEGGILFLSVPVGRDCLVWNLHRVYGKLRLSALLNGWKILGSFGFTQGHLYKEASLNYYQPVFVLTPTDSSIVIKNREGEGLFSMFIETLSMLSYYDKGFFKSVEVDFGLDGLYYDPKIGPNWWNYYFEPIMLKQEDLTSQSDKLLITPDRRLLPRREAYSLIQKYIHIRPSIESKIEEFFRVNLEGYYVIGVHYRGTDSLAQLPYKLYMDKIQSVVDSLDKNVAYRIFVASDENSFIETAEACFPNRICYQKESFRSINKSPLHFNSLIDRHRQGEEALIDCVLLSRSNMLLVSLSNLSVCALAMNPNVPVIDVSSKHHQYCLE